MVNARLRDVEPGGGGLQFIAAAGDDDVHRCAVGIMGCGRQRWLADLQWWRFMHSRVTAMTTCEGRRQLAVRGVGAYG